MSSLMANPPLEISELEPINRDIKTQPAAPPSIGMERDGIRTTRRLRVQPDGLVALLVLALKAKAALASGRQ